MRFGSSSSCFLPFSDFPLDFRKRDRQVDVVSGLKILAGDPPDCRLPGHLETCFGNSENVENLPLDSVQRVVDGCLRPVDGCAGWTEKGKKEREAENCLQNEILE